MRDLELEKRVFDLETEMRKMKKDRKDLVDAVVTETIRRLRAQHREKQDNVTPPSR